MKRKRNYSRLYAIATAQGIELAEQQEVLGSQFPGGRTTAGGEMTAAEYEGRCECLQGGRQAGESTAEYKERLRRARPAVLNRLQRLGVDTVDRTFATVNRFCMNSRIIGKPFGMLSVEELQALIPKLEAILRKPRTVKPQRIVHIPLFIRPDQLPS